MTGLAPAVPRLLPRRRAGVALAAIPSAFAAGWLVLASASGDYGQDAGPSLDALVRGHVVRALDLQPLMGALSLLVRAPFVFAAQLAGAGPDGLYRAGVVPCVAALAVLGVVLGRRAGRNGELVVPLVAVLSPASLAAVQSGHPEEALGAALAVAAVLLAERRALWAAAALGLAVATKQWAVLAAPPVIWLVPGRERMRAAGIAVAVAVVLTLPLALGSSSAFGRTSYNAATAPQVTSRATVWFLAAKPRVLHVHVPAGMNPTLTIRVLPAWVARMTHPLIVLVAPLIVLLVWRRRPTLADALALLALALLLRCVLDPVDNEYYHLPFLAALLALETTSRRTYRGLPLLTLFSAAGLWVTFDLFDQRALVSPAATNAVYLAWTTAVGAALALTLRRAHE